MEAHSLQLCGEKNRGKDMTDATEPGELEHDQLPQACWHIVHGFNSAKNTANRLRERYGDDMPNHHAMHYENCRGKVEAFAVAAEQIGSAGVDVEGIAEQYANENGLPMEEQ